MAAYNPASSVDQTVRSQRRGSSEGLESSALDVIRHDTSCKVGSHVEGPRQGPDLLSTE